MQKKNLLFVFTAILYCLNFTVSISQNLVPNSSFEVQDTCPLVSQITLAAPWNSPSVGTPDLFNSTCASQNSLARTGVGSSGVFCYSSFANSREYIQAPLTSSLVAGQTYCVTFYVKRTNFRYASNHIGAYFSVGSIYQSITNPLNFTPQVDNPPTNMLTSSSTWTQISGSFVASGGESHILIGSFYNDANTDTLVVNSADANKVAYYKIDDVSVVNCTPSSILDLENAEKSISIYPNPVNDIINLRLDADMNISNATIMDLHGRSIINMPLEVANQGVYSLEVSALPNGVYLLALQTSYGNVIKKIVVTR